MIQQGEVRWDSFPTDFTNTQQKFIQHNLGANPFLVTVRKADGKLVQAIPWVYGSDPANQLIIDDLGADYTSATVFVYAVATIVSQPLVSVRR